MNTLFFTHQHWRSSKTLRLNYGLVGMKYIIQVYDGEINGHGERECLPTEYQYEFKQEMLKHIHNPKKVLREKGWWERETPEFSQTSFLRSENSDAEFGFKFEKWSHVINVPSNKTLYLEYESKKTRTGSLFVRIVSRLSNQTTFIINMGEIGKIGRRNSLSLILPSVYISKVWTVLIFDS